MMSAVTAVSAGVIDEEQKGRFRGIVRADRATHLPARELDGGVGFGGGFVDGEEQAIPRNRADLRGLPAREPGQRWLGRRSRRLAPRAAAAPTGDDQTSAGPNIRALIASVA
jgi:hypothetical protein